MPMFVGSQSFISLPSFMFVSAVVSEIRELKEKEKKEEKKKNNSEIDYFQFNTFPGHLLYPFFNQRYLLSACTDSIYGAEDVGAEEAAKLAQWWKVAGITDHKLDPSPVL